MPNACQCPEKPARLSTKPHRFTASHPKQPNKSQGCPERNGLLPLSISYRLGGTFLVSKNKRYQSTSKICVLQFMFENNKESAFEARSHTSGQPAGHVASTAIEVQEISEMHRDKTPGQISPSF